MINRLGVPFAKTKGRTPAPWNLHRKGYSISQISLDNRSSIVYAPIAARVTFTIESGGKNNDIRTMG